MLLIFAPAVKALPQLTPAQFSTDKPDSAGLEGRPIVCITFDPVQQPVENPRLTASLGIHPGEPYRSGIIRDSIERLFATGRYEDIQVNADISPAGVSLRYVTRGAWFIGHVGTEGDLSDPPSSSQLVSAAKLELGMPFDEPRLAVAEAGMLQLLRGNGYFSAQVGHQLSFEAGQQQVHITFQVATGKRTRYGPAQVTGNTSVLTPRQIEKATSWRNFLLPGYRGITQNRTRDGVNGIRLKFQNAGHLLATVTLDSLEPANGRARATPQITVVPGPLVEITATGAKISRKQIRENVPVFEEHTVDADLLREGSLSLRDYLQRRGYFEASVRLENAQASEGTTRISYSVIPGSRHRLAALTISGNKYFDTKTIRERMFIVPRSFELRAGRYSESLRRRDEQVISDLYRDNGFRDAKVSSAVTDDYQGKEGDLAVSFHIVEGPQYKVASLEISGAKLLDMAPVIETLSSQTGQVFSEFNIGADRDVILRKYGSSGFPAATFQWSASPGPAPSTTAVRFLINEGEQEVVKQIVTTGLSTTRPNLVQTQMGVIAGDPLSPAALAETQRRLYDLGIFAQVNLAVQNPAGAENNRTVLYDVEEASRYSITTGLGAEFARIGGNNAVTDLSSPGGAPGFSPRFTFNVSRLNFLGRGETVSFQSRLSTLQKRAGATWFVPRAFGRSQFDATISAFYDDTHDVRTFQAQREEASVQFAHRVSKPITAFYRFTYRKVDVSYLKIDPLLLPRLAQGVRAGIVSWNLIQDRRDDPVEPRKGVYNTLDLGLATRVFGSQTSFVRLLARNATYHRLGEKIILARQTQLGFEPAFSVPAGSDPTDPVPLPERFFGGGGYTLRGVPENQAGPRDLVTGFPLGGTALFFNNTELRFPLLGANINGVLFEDAGNIFSRPGAMNFRTRQRDIPCPKNVVGFCKDFNYMVHAAGFGIRYKTPVGPIRADIAYSLNPPQYNGFAGDYSQLVQCSQKANCQAARQQISHFQFFFSIGQAF